MNNGDHKSRNDDEDRKLFLGGLSWETTEEDVKFYFSKFGGVVDVSIKYDAVSGNPRGFGFITFAASESVDSVLKAVPHMIKGKTIDPKRAKSRPICKKIFVGGLDSSIPEDEIRNYFSKFGPVEGIELPFDRQKNKRREFCFVIFESEESADTACSQAKQYVGNKECDIKKAQPQPVAQQQKRMQQGHFDGGYQGGRGGARGGRGRGGGPMGGSHGPPGAGGYDYAYPGYYGNYPQQYQQQGYPDYYNQFPPGYAGGYDYYSYYGFPPEGPVHGSTSGANSAVSGSDYAGATGNGTSGGDYISPHTTGGKIQRGKPNNSNYHPYAHGR